MFDDYSGLLLHFILNIHILDRSVKMRRANSGRKKKLSIENSLLMILEYIRKYRTYFHISQSYGLSESNAYKAVKCIQILHCLDAKRFYKELPFSFRVWQCDKCQTIHDRDVNASKNLLKLYTGSSSGIDTCEDTSGGRTGNWSTSHVDEARSNEWSICP